MRDVITGGRQVTLQDVPRNFLSKEKEKVNFQSVSILGNTNWGIPFVPKFYKTFQSNNDINDKLNSFEVNHNTFLNNHKEFQGHILPYLTGYSVLQNRGQLNFTRLAGINLPEFPELKPGFLLNNNYKIYAMTLQLQLLNNHSFNYQNTDTRFLHSIIITNGFSININSLNNNNFTFELITNNQALLNKTRPGNIQFSQRNLQDKIFTFSGDDKPTRKIKFNFNQFDEDFYWKHVLNTNLQRIDDFGYAIVHYDDIFNKIGYDVNDIKILNIDLNLLDNTYKDFREEMKTSYTPWIVSQGYYNSKQNLSRNDVGFKLEDRVKKLFKIHAMCPGKLGNEFIIGIKPISLDDSNGWAKFNLQLIDKKTDSVIYEFSNLNLNYDSPNFIGRVIGTQKIYFDITTKKVVMQGDFENQNPWIRVELSDDVINQNLSHDTIPAGFLGNNKFKTNLFNAANYSNINHKYVLNTQLHNLENNSFTKSVDILNNHAWGYNLKNISKIKVNYPVKKFSSISNDFIKSNRNNNQAFSFNMIKYELPERIGLEHNRKIDEHNYLNQNFYQTFDDENYNDMFHLEKIVLLNEYNESFNINTPYWEIARYMHSGQNISSLLQNNKFWDFFFQDGADLSKIFYYFTIYKEINNDLQTGQSNIIDSVNNNVISYNVNILSFNVEMLGGWDGLNLMDVNEYSINDKGLSQSQYLQEIYKLGLDIIDDESNGQNDIIYLPEIFQQNVIDYATDLIADNSYSMLLLDRPFYNINNEIIYSKQCLELDAGENNLEYGWLDQKYIYLNNTGIDNLAFDFNNTYSNWSQNTNRLNNVVSFGNYIHTRLLSGIQKNLNKFGKDQQLIIPGGVFGVSVLISYNQAFNTQTYMNPIYNTILNSLGDLTIIDTLDDTIDRDTPSRIISIKDVNNLNINLIYKDIKSGINQYSFFSNKTNQFDRGNNSILCKINVRNTLNYIKKLIKLSSYGILFNTATSVKDITKSCSVLYEIVLNKFLNLGLITNYRIMLDETTTSTEDLQMNIVRGAIYIQFNSQEIIQFNV